MNYRLFGHWLVYLLVRVLICFVQALRIETCARLARPLAVIATDILRIRGQVIDENLRCAFPEWTGQRRRHVTHQMWQHLILLVCEIAQVPRKIHETNWRKHIHLTGKSRRTFVRYFLDPRPLAVVSGHFGNFEVAGYASGLFGFPTVTVARPLDNPYLDRFLKRFRRATGQWILPKKGSAKQIAESLDRGYTLALLGDQDAGRKGCKVEFFGREASCHKAIAVFPLTSGAPLLVCYTKRVGRPLLFEMEVIGVADPEQGGPHLEGIKPLTQWYNRKLEAAIRKSPEQYWWLHRRWKRRSPDHRVDRKRRTVDRRSGQAA